MKDVFSWRRWFWAYRSAAGGWWVTVFGRGYHVVPYSEVREPDMAELIRVHQLEELVRSFVIDEIDYMTINHLGDPEQKHNIKWARKLGIADMLPTNPGA